MSEVSYKYLAESSEKFKELEDHITLFKQHVTFVEANNYDLQLIVRNLTEDIVNIIPDSRGTTIKQVTVNAKSLNGSGEKVISNVIYTEKNLHVTINGVSFIVTYKKGEND